MLPNDTPTDGGNKPKPPMYWPTGGGNDKPKPPLLPNDRPFPPIK